MSDVQWCKPDAGESLAITASGCLLRVEMDLQDPVWIWTVVRIQRDRSLYDSVIARGREAALRDAQNAAELAARVGA